MHGRSSTFTFFLTNFSMKKKRSPHISSAFIFSAFEIDMRLTTTHFHATNPETA
jgi:hypothetical protein